jgi:hypothetical protein
VNGYICSRNNNRKYEENRGSENSNGGEQRHVNENKRYVNMRTSGENTERETMFVVVDH